MIIKKVFNNNILLVQEENSKTSKILWGKGVGFQRQAGETIHPSAEDKLFVENTDSEWIKSFTNLANEIPMVYFETAKQVTEHAEKELGTSFNPFFIISLADHIYFSVQRAKNGLYDNLLINQIREKYYVEYTVALECLNIIRSNLNIDLPISESVFLAIHFVENRMEILKIKNKKTNVPEEEEKIISMILSFIVDELNLSTIKESIDFNRLLTHLRFLIRRIKNEETFEDTVEDKSLNCNLRKRLPKIAQISDSIGELLENHYQYTMSFSENTYLLMHIQQLSKQDFRH